MMLLKENQKVTIKKMGFWLNVKNNNNNNNKKMGFFLVRDSEQFTIRKRKEMMMMMMNLSLYTHASAFGVFFITCKSLCYAC